MQQKITYLIANYNNAKYLTDCLHSLQKQTNPHWQALIYDDASTDDSVKIIQELLPKFPIKKIKLYKQTKNKGKFYGLNLLISKATTEILAIFDPDDYLMPNATKEVLNFYYKNPQAKWTHSHYQEMNENLTKILKIRGKHIPSHLSFLAFGNITHLLSFKNATYKQITPINSKLYFAEDKDLIYKLEEQGECGFIPKVLYKYRTVPQSATHNKKNRSVGMQNHYNIQKKTLARRKVVGVQRLCYLILFWLITIYYPYRYPFVVRAIFFLLHRVLRVVFRPFLKNQFQR